MSLENLDYTFTLQFRNYPIEWLPFLYLYDADIPLFPLQYFHAVREDLPQGHHYGATERVFGYVERTHFTGAELEVTVVCNKDLANPHNSVYLRLANIEVAERLGISNPVTRVDLNSPFQPENNPANLVLPQIWQRVVANILGDKLPFGRFYDSILGLGRCVASFNSPGGRKAEWIETHYYCSRFGERIKIADNLPKMDFYLLPTFKEVVGPNSSLILFPNFRKLKSAAKDFHRKFCSVKAIGGGLTFSKFNKPGKGSLNSKKLLRCINQLNSASVNSLIQCFNAFDKGPPRTVLFLLMLNDIIAHRLSPQDLTPSQFGFIYDGLGRSYQSPKVVALYAQQCFGNSSAFPIDTWMKTLLKWPLAVYPAKGKKVQNLLANTQNLGKVERLLWIAAQARKIHSSLCNDSLWCIKYDSSRKPRGGNPFACNACYTPIRDSCPAYAEIANDTISFNARRGRNKFVIESSRKNNTAASQTFVLCKGVDKYGKVHDDFTPIDMPTSFKVFPSPNHRDQAITVSQFVQIY